MDGVIYCFNDLTPQIQKTVIEIGLILRSDHSGLMHYTTIFSELKIILTIIYYFARREVIGYNCNCNSCEADRNTYFSCLIWKTVLEKFNKYTPEIQVEMDWLLEGKPKQPFTR